MAIQYTVHKQLARLLQVGVGPQMARSGRVKAENPSLGVERIVHTGPLAAEQGLGTNGEGNGGRKQIGVVDVAC